MNDDRKSTVPDDSAKTDAAAKSETPQRKPSRIRLMATWLTLVLFAGVGCTVLFHVAIWRANISLEARRHSAALNWLRTATNLQLLPWIGDSSGELDYLLARTYRRLKEFEKVKPRLQAAQDAGWSETLLQREVILNYAQTGQYERVNPHWSELFKNAGSDGPEICDAYVKLALARFRVDSAAKVIDSWKQDFPDDPDPHFLQGEILAVQLKWPEAGEAYRAALKRNPDHVDARVGLAESMMKEVKFKVAEQELADVLKSNPQHDEARLLRANCLARIDRIPEAVSELQQILKSSPKNYDVLVELGKLKSKLAEHQAAVELLERALKLRPEDSQTHYVLAQALQALGRKDEAKPHLEIVHEATRPYQQLSILTNKLVTNADDPDLRYEIGMITWKYRSRAEGVQWFQSVLELNPFHKATHRALARHFRLVGDTERAAQHVKVVGSDPESD